jgi:glutamyl-Q tRNA(Asp) synthetase
MNSGELCFIDSIQGAYCQQIEKEVGDYVLKRADGLFAYQLAVVVDDEEQAITHVVRGSDLLDNTPRQIFLQKKLGYATPNYAHFPVATYRSGKKLSKQNKAPVVSTETPLVDIHNALSFLGQKPPPLSDFSTLEDLWKWSIKHWTLTNIPKQQTITLSDL